MKVSIITPVYNGIDFIEACVDNVAHQAVPDLEHIIVDGGSSDGTLAEVARLASVHQHVRLLTGPDQGQSDALNKGVRAAQGRMIGILNVDDFYEYGAITQAAEVLEARRSPALVAANCKTIDESQGTVTWDRPYRLSKRDFLKGNQIPGNPSAYFYHKDVHDLVGEYDVNNHLAMDLDFLLSCAGVIDMIYVDSHWGNFRLRPGCKTYDNSGSAGRRVNALLNRHSVGYSMTDRCYFSIRRLAGRIRGRLARDLRTAFRPSRGHDAR